MTDTPAPLPLPFVSVVTCTYNRQKFFTNLKNIVSAQDYPHNLMEWIIIDDSPGTDSSADFPADISGIAVHYYYLKSKVSLAKKRNFLNHKATGKYIINMDDDDYYPPCRVSHAVQELTASGRAIAGSSKMFMYFSHDKSVYQLGPYQDSHGTAATMAYTKEYTAGHDFGNGDYAEEAVFTDTWKCPMVQLDPLKTVLALSHSDNTIDKTMFLNERYGHLGRSVHPTSLKLSDFISRDKEQEVYDFYDSLTYEYKVTPITREVIDKMENNAVESAKRYQQTALQKLIGELTIVRQQYEKEMLFIHKKNVGRLTVTYN